MLHRLLAVANYYIAPYNYLYKFAVGAQHTGSAWIRPFRGDLAEIRLWSLVRSEEEIRRNRTKRLQGNEPGLLGHWRLNEGMDFIAADYSTNSFHGQIYGSTWIDIDDSPYAFDWTGTVISCY